MTDELMHWFAYPRVPDNRALIKRTSQNKISIGVEMQRNQFPLMPLQRGVDLPHLHIPQLRRAVHRPSSNKRAIGIKRYGNNFSLMPSIGRQQLTSNRIPDLGSLVKRSRANLIAIGHVEGHTVDRILMSLKRVDEVARVCIPQLAGPIITTSDELVSVLIEAAIGEWQHVAFQFLYQHELLLTFLFDLLHQL